MTSEDESSPGIPEQLARIAEAVEEGDRPTESPRTLIHWFGARRRGSRISARIRKALKSLGLATFPDFQHEYIDGEIAFMPRDAAAAREEELKRTESTEPAAETTEATAEDATGDSGTVATDPTYRVGKLEAANKPPVCVAPNDGLRKAITLMLQHDFSQLPVMGGEYVTHVKGMVTWQAIGSRCVLGKEPTEVRNCMEKPEIVSSEASMLDVASRLAHRQAVLVHNREQKICGIVTAYDLAEQFRELGQPFLMLGEIENHIRSFLDGPFSPDELAAGCDPGDGTREVEGVEDLTFGEYLRLLETPDNWQRIRLKLDRAEFVRRLDEVRRIRNDVMHFDPDGIAEEDLVTLQQTCKFLRELSHLHRRG